jgi:hypothetical protein
MPRRPFYKDIQYLYPSTGEVSNAEFWDHVAESTLGNHMAQVFDDEDYDITTDLPVQPCDVCGTAEAACGYDEFGRSYVHCSLEED